MITTCGKCEFYSRSLGRCKNGKVNPKTFKNTLKAARIMGFDYICKYSKWKTRTFLRLIQE